MPKDNPLNQSQSDPCAFEIIHAMQPLKHSKQFRRVLHVKTNSVVLDEVCVLIPAFLKSNLDGWIRLRPGELERIGNQVVQNLPEHGPVPESRRQFLDIEGNLP